MEFNEAGKVRGCFDCTVNGRLYCDTHGEASRYGRSEKNLQRFGMTMVLTLAIETAGVLWWLHH